MNQVAPFLFLVFFSSFIATHAQIVSIPDASFKDKLINHIPLIDTNMDGEIQVSEAEAFTETIDVSGTSAVPGSISDLTGIEAFVNIEGLACDYNDITELNLSSNSALLEVSSSHNMIAAVNLTGNPLLRTLSISENAITNVDLSANTDLFFFQCNYCNLNTLDLSNNPALQFLYVQGNAITSLDLSGNPGLFIVNLDNNQLASVDVTGSPLLDFLFCRGNNLQQLDLSNNVNLRRLDCKSNSVLTYINLRNGNNDQLFIDGAQASNFEDLPALETVCLDDAGSPLATYITTQVGHSVTFIEDCNLGISENVAVSFYAYPNPTKGILNIRSHNSVIRVAIYSIQGKLVHSEEVNANRITLDLSPLNQGIYFLKAYDTFGNRELRKIIKK
ncbi:MAG: T9SS type A sorting domain-containing protein [Altibacter sp.]|uniref:T9SS type A sorting domain-containing protein n=1 Tax=Altibacter sp. TaxID=2024823 RepID=UPI001DFF5048|nr:T9SS type A sorting domain-containing protein [Altibacter sp.]MBZ0327430.1 T9SS type A sorting domain-containing protein [Altibacter sp.]